MLVIKRNFPLADQRSAKAADQRIEKPVSGDLVAVYRLPYRSKPICETPASAQSATVSAAAIKARRCLHA